MNDLSPVTQQQELIGLLAHELTEMLAFDCSALQGEDEAARIAVLQELCQHCSNLGSAANLIGLTGLRNGCQHLVRNFSAYAHAPELVGAHNLDLFEGWCPLLLNYVVNFGRDGEADAIEFFLDYAGGNEWLSPLLPEELLQLRQDFASSVVLLGESNAQHALPDFVDEDLVSLRIDADVNTELLDGLLIELPGQGQAFAEAIEALVRRADFSALAVAQRMAHTIKGSANVVGIRGIANLMHYVEDILDRLAKTHGPDEVQPLALSLQDLLEDVADSLASMIEYLLGLGGYPEQTQEVLGRVIHWLKEAQQPACAPLAEGLADGPVPVLVVRDCAGEPEAEMAPCLALMTALDPKPEIPSLMEPVSRSEADIGETAAVANDASRAAEPMPLLLAESAIEAAHQLEPQRGGVSPAPMVEPVVDEEVAEVRHTLTVPDLSAQELLRLAGENQIASNQVLSRIGLVTGGVKSADGYHQKIRQVASQLEKLVQSQSIRGVAQSAMDAGELDPLEMEHYNELHSFSNQLQELTTDAHEAVLSIESQLKELSNLVLAQRQSGSEAQALLLKIGMLPVALITPRLTRCVRQAARLTHKSVMITIYGDDVLVDSRLLNRVVDPLMHLLRNAVDHGIEISAQQRLEQGKPAEGKITVSFARRGEILRVEVRDDGKGFDYFRIEHLARERGLLPMDQAVTHNELHKILVMPGFSTRQQVSQTSGRGIGLDVVHSQMQLLKGSFSLQSEPGMGSGFVLEMPMSLLSAHTLQIRMGQHRLSVLSRPLSQIIHLQPGDVNWQQETPQFQFGSALLDVLCFDEIATLQNLEKPSHYSALLVVNRLEAGPVAVAVEAVVASEDQIIKPLNKFASKSAGVIGVAILGDGSLSPVIDLPELPKLQMAPAEYLRWRKSHAQLRQQARPVTPKPIALVVDDSLSARRSLAQFMRDLGMDVCTAKDGFEAIQVMQQCKPSILLVDLEMPRMNGLELTTHVRASTDAQLPIVMVTSRTTERHKQMAAAAGVNAYLSKPWSEDELLEIIQNQLGALA